LEKPGDTQKNNNQYNEYPGVFFRGLI